MDIRRFLGRNIRYKIISAVCAFALWFFVSGQAESLSLLGNNIFSVQIELRNAPANLVVLNELPAVNVEVKGQDRQLSVTDIHAYIDLTNATLGKASYVVEVEALEGAEIKKVSPTSVPLNIDQLIDKPMRVEAQVTGKPAQGYVMGDPILTPEEVMVRGPQSVVEKMEKVAVEINIDGEQSTVRASRPIVYKDFGVWDLFAPDPELKSLTALTSAVEVIVPIFEADKVNKKVPVRLNVSGNLASGYELRSYESLPASVTVIGTEEVLSKVSYVDLGTINIEGLTESKAFDIDMNTLSLPEGVSLVSGTKIKVMVNVRQTIHQITVEGVPVAFQNQRAGYTYSTVNPVNIVVRGYPDDLQTISNTSLVFWIDLAQLDQGTHSVDVLWNEMPPGVTPVQVPKVTVTVTAPVTEPEGPD